MLLQNLYYQIVAKALCEHSPIQEKSDSFGSLFVVISQASRDNQPANHQTTRQQNNKTTRQQNNQICLEDNTEQSESNPGRSLGIIIMKRKTVWKTVPNSQNSH